MKKVERCILMEIRQPKSIEAASIRTDDCG